MINQKISKMLNDQITMELYSGYLYMDMARYYAEAGLDGFAHWFTMQAQEEYSHAMIIRTYLLNNDEHITYSTIEDPTTPYADHKAPLVIALDHEREITASINKIYAAAIEEKDYRSIKFLDWFIKEQEEEEINVTNLIIKYDLFVTGSSGLYQLNEEFGARPYESAVFDID